MVLYRLRVINTFTKVQQTSLLAHLRRLTKKNPNDTLQELVVKFLEEQDYFFSIKQPMFEWLEPYIEQSDFILDIKIIIADNLKYISFYEKQKAHREKQKAFAKLVREKITKERQSRLKPTKKQIDYYNDLCCKHNVDRIDLTDKSRLDLKNLISAIVDK